MRLRLDHHSGEPIYRQIVEQVKYQAASGGLVEGEKLPSIRALAKDLKINPRTVVRAYEELQSTGLVVMRQGQGVFLRERRVATPLSERRRVIREMAQRMLSEAARMGAEPDEVIDVLRKASEEMKGK